MPKRLPRCAPAPVCCTNARDQDLPAVVPSQLAARVPRQLQLLRQTPFWLKLMLYSLVYQAAYCRSLLRAAALAAETVVTVFFPGVFVYAAITIIPTRATPRCRGCSMRFFSLPPATCFGLWYLARAGLITVVGHGSDYHDHHAYVRAKVSPASGADDGPLRVALFPYVFYPTIDGWGTSIPMPDACCCVVSPICRAPMRITGVHSACARRDENSGVCYQFSMPWFSLRARRFSREPVLTCSRHSPSSSANLPFPLGRAGRAGGRHLPQQVLRRYAEHHPQQNDCAAGHKPHRKVLLQGG